jgi:hypothetical protein
MSGSREGLGTQDTVMFIHNSGYVNDFVRINASDHGRICSVLFVHVISPTDPFKMMVCTFESIART